MLKRLWLVVSVLWALFVFWGYTDLFTRAPQSSQVEQMLIMAAFPFVGGLILARLGRFVIHGK